MLNTTTNKFADNLVYLAVPLFVVAGLAEALGATVGNGSTIAAVALAAFVGTIFRHFAERPLAKALGTAHGSVQFYLAMGGINAAFAGASVAIVRNTLGF